MAPLSNTASVKKPPFLTIHSQQHIPVAAHSSDTASSSPTSISPPNSAVFSTFPPHSASRTLSITAIIVPSIVAFAILVLYISHRVRSVCKKVPFSASVAMKIAGLCKEQCNPRQNKGRQLQLMAAWGGMRSATEESKKDSSLDETVSLDDVYHAKPRRCSYVSSCFTASMPSLMNGSSTSVCSPPPGASTATLGSVTSTFAIQRTEHGNNRNGFHFNGRNASTSYLSKKDKDFRTLLPQMAGYNLGENLYGFAYANNNDFLPYSLYTNTVLHEAVATNHFDLNHSKIDAIDLELPRPPIPAFFLDRVVPAVPRPIVTLTPQDKIYLPAASKLRKETNPEAFGDERRSWAKSWYATSPVSTRGSFYITYDSLSCDMRVDRPNNKEDWGIIGINTLSAHSQPQVNAPLGPSGPCPTLPIPPEPRRVTFDLSVAPFNSHKASGGLALRSISAQRAKTHHTFKAASVQLEYGYLGNQQTDSLSTREVRAGESIGLGWPSVLGGPSYTVPPAPSTETQSTEKSTSQSSVTAQHHGTTFDENYVVPTSDESVESEFVDSKGMLNDLIHTLQIKSSCSANSFDKLLVDLESPPRMSFDLPTSTTNLELSPLGHSSFLANSTLVADPQVLLSESNTRDSLSECTNGGQADFNEKA
ncbi:uncharacterized protein L203_102196 [Cryptococcus depauperatus CBS 7841]|uniref:Uncharacterized protein n=1 Tax=Cryptococcus depauperatus CBS 7841 TaxID=1295531 RepID=A0A1E3IRL3_9TREE|nr:hypothetical protein L203_01451 [Cryptococcus depauperatus CBS 7841]